MYGRLQRKVWAIGLVAGTLIQVQRIELYISSLADYIAIDVELHNSPNLAMVMSISKLNEREEQPLCSQ